MAAFRFLFKTVLILFISLEILALNSTTPTAGNREKNITTIQKPPITLSSTTNVPITKQAPAKDDKIIAHTDTTHLGREHVMEPKDSSSSTPKPENKTTTPAINVFLSSTPLPVSDHMLKVNVTNHLHAKPTPSFVISEKNDNKTSVPKKGAVNEIRMKPTITESDDDDENGLNVEVVEKVETIPPSLDEGKHQHKADYIVPIVAVILSVPLVAIIVSVLYKRFGEWWQHRHYRRMDFLIDGMYNT